MCILALRSYKFNNHPSYCMSLPYGNHDRREGKSYDIFSEIWLCHAESSAGKPWNSGLASFLFPFCLLEKAIRGGGPRPPALIHATLSGPPTKSWLRLFSASHSASWGAATWKVKIHSLNMKKLNHPWTKRPTRAPFPPICASTVSRYSTLLWCHLQVRRKQVYCTRERISLSLFLIFFLSDPSLYLI